MSDLRELLRGIEVFSGELPEFDLTELPADPHELFIDWLLGAVREGIREPHAMTLSTVDPEGDPDARVLILKNISAEGWEFASDGRSRKGRDLAGRPAAALTFYWPEQARQVRVRGAVAPATAQDSAADFLARTATARAEALLGRQSTPLGGFAEREAAVRATAARIEDDPGLVSPDWTLYVLRPHRVEFWQGREDRSHTRVAYTRGAGAWERGLLWP
ncbi:pyridoxal 5'-phosphate synthase [Streptomyces sp. V4-01]|uniref:Pyridoxal 5'-phosphate synthase n=1 Tax=Actinacidiphila polyblastidii TaxID=3110430 RepID=A0ABU7PHR8_9ACTN|nr:pyridoxal 5'-phosphate synthase [Streptomyces sp. V4-01]